MVSIVVPYLFFCCILFTPFAKSHNFVKKHGKGIQHENLVTNVHDVNCVHKIKHIT